jgi:hypothetical protein
MPKKLGIKEGHRVTVVNPPESFVKTLGVLPAGARIQVGLSGNASFNVLVVFVTSRGQLQRQIAANRRHMISAAGL